MFIILFIFHASTLPPSCFLVESTLTSSTKSSFLRQGAVLLQVFDMNVFFFAEKKKKKERKSKSRTGDC